MNNNQGCFLGLDIGGRRIGVALSDYTGFLAEGVEVIDRQKGDWKTRLDQLIELHAVGAIVIGIPYNMDGSAGGQAKYCQEIAAELAGRYQLPIHLWDERLSSKAAERMLLLGSMRRKKRKQISDQVAAAWILQGFLDANKR